jgi:hypothetical protein
MSRIRIPSGLVALFVGATLYTSGCSRPLGLPTEGATTQTDQTPFRDDGGKSGNPSLADFASTPSDTGASHDQIPFRDAQSLPIGTLLTIRLKSTVSAENSSANNKFDAVLDEPILLRGDTLVPRGIAASGRVESIRTSDLKPSRGYIRLVLASVHLGGIDVPVQTASLFVRPPSGVEPAAHGMRLEKGRRLTFRLTEPLYTSNQSARLAP